MIKLPKTLADWNKNPWDKVAHTLFLIGWGLPVAYLSDKVPPGILGAMAGAWFLWGREQVQAAKFVGEVKSYFPANWHLDGKLDVLLPIMFGTPALMLISTLWE